MSESASKLDPARRRWRCHLTGWGLVVLAVTATVAVVLWAPPARTTPLVALLGVIVTAVVGWRGSNRR
ncbi:hypothetical protein [Actinomadura sp. 9N407]|uniref:hypothetical protein n=1 Tax=Actinomadura sp. 9N407 TaxID=3375154 RepID=UPI0037A4D9AA